MVRERIFLGESRRFRSLGRLVEETSNFPLTHAFLVLAFASQSSRRNPSDRVD